MNQRNIMMLPVATGQGRMDKLEGDEIHQVLSIYEDKYFNILTLKNPYYILIIKENTR